MTRSGALSIAAIYGANATGALGHLLVVSLLTLWIGFAGYGLVSLYFLAFALPLAFEPAVVRSGVDLHMSSPETAAQEGLLGAWALLGILAGAAIALVVALLLPSPSEDEWAAPLLLMIGFIDYAAGTVFLGRTVFASARGRHLAIARVALVQTLSRYTCLLALLWVGRGEVAALTLLPLRRLGEYMLLRSVPTNGVSLSWRSLRAGWRALLDSLRRFGSVIGWLLLGTEGIGVLVYVGFGVSEFGRYRASFDLASKVWFVATIFPLVLYPHLRVAERGAQLVRRLGAAFGLGLTAYMSLVVAGLVFAPWVFALAFPALVGSENLFAGVLLGVALVGHARLGLECLQAFGAAHAAASHAAMFSVGLLGLVLTGSLLGAGSVAVVLTVGWVLAGAALALLVDDASMREAGAGPARRWAIGARSALLMLGTSVCLWLLSGAPK